MTEAKELVREAMLVHKMFLRPEDRRVVEQSVKDVDRLADRTGNHLGVKYTVLIRDMGVDRQGLIVIAEVAWIERTQEGTGLEPEALTIGRRHGPITPHGTER